MYPTRVYWRPTNFYRRRLLLRSGSGGQGFGYQEVLWIRQTYGWEQVRRNSRPHRHSYSQSTDSTRGMMQMMGYKDDSCAETLGDRHG